MTQNKTYGLIIAKDYWGTVKGVETALRFRDFLVNHNIIHESDIRLLVGDDVHVQSVLTEFKLLLTKLNEADTTCIAYMIGHGNIMSVADSKDPDHMEVCYQLPDGNVDEEELTEIADESGMTSTSKLVLISDHCSSGTLLDEPLTTSGCNWIDIASCQRYEDSYTTDVGNIMTYCLIEALEKHPDDISVIKTILLKDLLVEEMKNSFIGELQNPCITVSHPDMWDAKCFSST